MKSMNFNGVELASGKAKGAAGSHTLLVGLSTIAARPEYRFTPGAREQIRSLSQMIKSCGSDEDLTSAYHLAQLAEDQFLLYGNVWLQVGHGFCCSCHFEIISDSIRDKIECALSNGVGLLTEQPILFSSSKDGARAIFSWTRLMKRTLGE